VQEERVIRGEPSDRLNVVREGMRQTEMDYEVLKELLKDEDFRKFSDRVLELRARVRMRRESSRD
jgi:hypothetical protein